KFRLCRRTGGRIDGLFLLEQADGSWEVLLRNAGRIKPDESLSFAGINEPCPWSVKPQENLGQGRWRIGVEPADQAVEVLAKVGRAPLPPYIRRQGGTDAHDRHDAERYQTVYASQPGAVAAPTAGLHFTTEVLDELARRWIERVEVTLHVGLGTFSPVAVDDLTDHTIHAEWYALSASAAARLNAVRAAGGRIVAVGTTSVRVLESCVDAEGVLLPKSGWTRLFCYPPYTFRAVDAMLTNFHLPHSTLLALVMAYGGVEAIRRAYAHAVKSDYRFYSYGDAMFIA
ncbi:MAG: tRNA preQ1(34) S-adenosylmethionine ribosyltransferase-isomerase QueA, partial [bacterium]|nr:tRNA preQ1(34) S-adenosylmethionine ribosyltransferase-isomerase QueA [bacterium]